MSDERRDERIRVQLTLRGDSPAYALLKACMTAPQRRKAAVSLMETAAAAFTAGFATPRPQAPTGSTLQNEAPQRKAVAKHTSLEAKATELDYSRENTAALDFLLGS